MPTSEINPIIVPVPTAALLANAVRVPLNRGSVLQSNRVIRIEGYLAALTSGIFTVEIRDIFDGSLIGTISWTAAGFSTSGQIDYAMAQETSGLSVAPTSLGVGAQSCVLTIWNLMEF